MKEKLYSAVTKKTEMSQRRQYNGAARFGGSSSTAAAAAAVASASSSSTYKQPVQSSGSSHSGARRQHTAYTQRKPVPQMVAKKTPKKSEPLALPLIYKTKIPEQLLEALTGDVHKVIVLLAPTGLGKTVMANAIMAQIQKDLYKKGISTTCTSIMPFRVSVIEMWDYINKLFPDYKFGYAMRGDNQTTPSDNVRLNTVGYWLEKMMSEFRENGLPTTPQIVMVDEAHDATWQTDLALRLLLWMQKQGAPIKIVVTSATLDVAQTLRASHLSPLVLSAEDQKANVDVIHLDYFITAEEKGKLSDQMYAEITKKLVHISETSEDGDILVMLPGQDEITGYIETLEKNAKLSECVILPLYSAMDKDDIAMAIKPNPDSKRKIIVATNIVENAITIDNLMFVIDCGYRKVSEIDSDGVQQLVLRPAARSNMKQALGRVGRQGRRGTAYLMLTQRDFEWRQAFSENEVQRNPLYLQIIKLLRDGLPVKDVLSHIDPYRIERDTLFLIAHGALEKTDDGKIVVTELGKIMAQLPLAIRSAHFLAQAVSTLDPSLWYAAAVAAAWMDNGSSVFFRPGRKPREDPAEYDARLQIIQDSQEEFFEKDCLTTMFNVWFSSWNIPDGYKGGFRGWCKDNGIFDRTLKDIGSAVNHIIGSLESMKFIVNIPTQEKCGLLVKDVNDIVTGLIPALEIAYKDWVFCQGFDGDYYREGTFGGYKYSIDRFLRNGSLISGDRPVRVMALSLKRIAPTRIIMSNLVNLPVRKSEVDGEDY